MRLFIQIPESERIFRDLALEDVYYEHCNYFTEASLGGLFRRHGFTVDEVDAGIRRPVPDHPRPLHRARPRAAGEDAARCRGGCAGW